MVSDDVMAAFVTKWVADSGAGGLQTLIAGGPKAGKIPSPLETPYCGMVVRQEKKPENSSGGPTVPSIHYQRVVLTVFGKYDDVDAVTGRINTVFSNASANGSKTLAILNSTHMWTEVEDPGTLAVDPTRSSDAEEVWTSVIQYIVWLSRTLP